MKADVKPMAQAMGNVIELPMRASSTTSMADSVIATRPLPPQDLWKEWNPGEMGIDDDGGGSGSMSTPRLFVPDHNLETWIRDVFISGDGPIVNEEHYHLDWATLGCLWTCVPMNQKMRDVAATCEMPRAQGNKWQKSRADYQLIQWFGQVPDFLLTFFAPYCTAASDEVFCAVVEHELYHAGQKRDEFDQPKFNEKTGNPCFGIKDHDVSEHVGVTRRWGAGVSANVPELVEAALMEPLIKRVDVRAVCGRCAAKVA
jgi:hypothetical protein